MKISTNPYNQINNTASNQSFGAICVDKVKLLKKNGKGIYKPIKAKVLELDSFNKKDRKLVNKLEKLWKKAQYTECICSEFFANKTTSDRFFAVQTKNGLKKQITNLMEIDMPFDDAVKNFKLCIKYLQSAPDIANIRSPKIKGSGEIALYEAVKIAEKNKTDSLFLFSTNDKFYEKAGLNKEIEIANCSLFKLSKENFMNFLNRVKTKYNFK